MVTHHFRSIVLITLAVGALAAGACSNSDMTPSPTGPSTMTPTPTPEPPPPARYLVTFTATWSAATHAAPSDPHFSPLIGATHKSSVVFWREGGLATEGVRTMAEQGRTSPLDTEVQAAISAGTAQHLLKGVGIDSPGTTSLEFDISADFPLVTLVTMVAPSPDWFTGVSGLTLLDGARWLDERTVSLIPYDAGTDSGTTFTSPDVATSPRELITKILTPPLGTGGSAAPLGTYTFRRIGS